MTKFKIGDKVRIVRINRGRAPGSEYVGREFVIGSDCGEYEGEQSWGGSESEEGRPAMPWRWLESEIEPVNDGPVRIVTRREIVPGVYGRVEVTGTYKSNRVTLDWTGNGSIHSAVAIVGLDAEELRAAAAVLTQLADALEDK